MLYLYWGSKQNEAQSCCHIWLLKKMKYIVKALSEIDMIVIMMMVSYSDYSGFWDCVSTGSHSIGLNHTDYGGCSFLNYPSGINNISMHISLSAYSIAHSEVICLYVNMHGTQDCIIYHITICVSCKFEGENVREEQ